MVVETGLISIRGSPTDFTRADGTLSLQTKIGKLTAVSRNNLKSDYEKPICCVIKVYINAICTGISFTNSRGYYRPTADDDITVHACPKFGEGSD